MDRQFGGRGNFTPPVSVGEELDVNIEAVGEKGDGIAKKRGFVIFIPNTQAGQVVRIKVTKVLKNVGFGEVIGEAQGEPEADRKPKTVAVNNSDLEPEVEQSSNDEVQLEGESEDFGNDDEDN